MRILWLRTLFGIGTLLVAHAAGATVLQYTATLNGLNEAPPNASGGTGSALFTVDTQGHTLRVQTSFSGLTGTTTASHVHCCTTTAGIGTAGVATTVPTFFNFPLGVSSGTYDGLLNLTLASSYNPAFVLANGGSIPSAESVLLAGLQAGTSYFNIHTTFLPAGEIRGFLLPSAVTAVPEPSPFGLVAIGAMALALAGRRRRRRR